jgi:hypothetical protein
LFKGQKDRFLEMVYNDEKEGAAHRKERGWDLADVSSVPQWTTGFLEEMGLLIYQKGDTIIDLAKRNDKESCHARLKSMALEIKAADSRGQKSSYKEISAKDQQSCLDPDTGSGVVFDAVPNPFKPSLGPHKRDSAHDCALSKPEEQDTTLLVTAVKQNDVKVIDTSQNILGPFKPIQRVPAEIFKPIQRTAAEALALLHATTIEEATETLKFVSEGDMNKPIAAELEMQRDRFDKARATAAELHVGDLNNDGEQPHVEVFESTLTNLTVHDGRWFQIPTCAACAEVSLKRAEPDNLEITFGKDSADNLFARVSGFGQKGHSILAGVNLIYTLRARTSYFTDYKHYAVDDKHASELAKAAVSMLPNVGAVTMAHGVATQMAGVQETHTYFQRLDQLVKYFRSFKQRPLNMEALTNKAKGSLYLALCQQKAGVCRHRAFCFVITALSQGIRARYLTSDTHAWVEVEVPKPKSFAGKTVPAFWHRVELGGGAATVNMRDHPDGGLPSRHKPKKLDGEGAFDIPANDARDNDKLVDTDVTEDEAVNGGPPPPKTPGGDQANDSGSSVGPGKAKSPPKGNPMKPQDVEAMLDSAEQKCRDTMRDHIHEKGGWAEGGTCSREWNEKCHIKKSQVKVEGLELWLPEDQLDTSLDSLRLHPARLFAYMLNMLVFDTFEGIKRNAIKLFWDNDSNTVAFNMGGSLFFNLAFYMKLEHCDKPIEAVTSFICFSRLSFLPLLSFYIAVSPNSCIQMYFWYHTTCHEVAHNIEKGHGPGHNFVLQLLATRHFQKLVMNMEKMGHWKATYQAKEIIESKEKTNEGEKKGMKELQEGRKVNTQPPPPPPLRRNQRKEEKEGREGKTLKDKKRGGGGRTRRGKNKRDRKKEVDVKQHRYCHGDLPKFNPVFILEKLDRRVNAYN